MKKIYKIKIPQWKKKFDCFEILKSLKKTILNKSFSEGKVTKNFENEISKFLRVKYVVTFTSGTTALLSALLALRLKSNDEIIISNRGWISVYNVAKHLNLKIKFVDVEKSRPVLDVKKIESQITKNTKVIIPVHMGGRMCDMHNLVKLAKKYKINIIEDAAQAFGVIYKGKFAGTLSDVGCFSMSVTKTISSGQGGFVVTNNKKLFFNLKKIKNNGLLNIQNIPKWGNQGLNFKFSDILSTIALNELKKFRIYKDKLIKNYYFFLNKLNNINDLSVIPVHIEKGEIPQYVEILAKRRGLLFKFMRKNFIDCRIFYPNLNKASKQHKKIVYKNSNRFEKDGLYLPSGPSQSLNNLNKVVELIKKFYNQ